MMNKLNEAQQLREALGIEVAPFGVGELRASATKRGPGRVHVSGTKRDKPITPRPPMGFVRHTATAAKQLRRACVKLSGIRQHKRAQRDGKILPAGFVD